MNFGATDILGTDNRLSVLFAMSCDNQTRDITKRNVEEHSFDGTIAKYANVKSILLPYGELLEIVKAVNEMR